MLMRSVPNGPTNKVVSALVCTPFADVGNWTLDPYHTFSIEESGYVAWVRINMQTGTIQSVLDVYGPGLPTIASFGFPPV